MKLTRFFRKLHRCLFLFNIVFWFIILYLPLKYFSGKPERYWGMVMLRRWWARLSTFFSGIVFSFEYEEAIDWNKTYMICPYHTSNLDTSMVSILVKNNKVCIMGKNELKDNFVTGVFFRTVDLPVDRTSKIASFRAFKAAGERLKSGINMIMFPEGGIENDYPPHLQEFKSGPFRLAIEHKVPVLAITSLDTWEKMWDDGAKYGSRPGICRVFVHKPVETFHLTVDDAEKLEDEVFRMMAEKLAEVK